MILFNATEFIEDCMAMGQTYTEAVAAAREEIALRKEVAKRNKGREYQADKGYRHDRSSQTR